MRLKILICLLVAAAAAVNAESNPESNPDLAAEHRSAKPEPFLEKLASALGFGSSSSPNNEKKYRPPKPPGRPKPVYKRPPVQHGLPSIQKPIVAASRPASGGYGAPKAPAIGHRPPARPPVRPPLTPAASNNFPNYFNGGGKRSLFNFFCLFFFSFCFSVCLFFFLLFLTCFLSSCLCLSLSLSFSLS